MEIDQLIANYRPDQIVTDILRKSKIVFFTGIISAGKDALQNELIKSSEYYHIVTHTTRSPRINKGELEKDGIDYHFITRNQMAELLVEHKMVEVNHFGDNYYGTSIEEFKLANQNNKIAIGDIDIHGISAMQTIAPQNVVAIFVVPPDYNTWINRIKIRYDSLESFNREWQTRREITINELEYTLDVPYYHFLINDDLDLAVKTASRIVHADGINYEDSEARICAKKLLNDIKRAS
jgi:guanylate kinase